MTGRSAGGLAVGMFCNLWPHLLQAAILQVAMVFYIDYFCEIIIILLLWETMHSGPLGNRKRHGCY